jgi:hypothetical protein
VDSAASGLGVDTGAGSATDPVTKPVDDATTSGLNTAGSAVGDPNLGTQANQTVSGVTGGLLGGGGG